MFESLTQRLEAAFKRLRGQGRLTEANMKEALQEIRQALLEADVHYKVVKKFIADVQEAALGRKVLESIHPSQMVVKIVHDELVRLMGERNEPLRLAEKGLSVIMMVGLQGQGKTTTAGKLAGLLKRRGRNPMLVAADVYRPAAVEQLETVARQVGVDLADAFGDELQHLEFALRHAGQRTGGCTVQRRAARSADEKTTHSAQDRGPGLGRVVAGRQHDDP
ncbi:MAG TPA: signal recognition particle receptor subunit alpha [Candidatus Hydrogenedentes bacterium]|nr:signal recognition particle receptor subunit alpha [Candidatus Hydrogenedentota bacterium]